MNAAAPPSALGLGLYPLPEAARLAQLDLRAARRWAQGYAYRYNGGTRSSSGVFPLTLGQMGQTRDLTFVEMLTLRLVRAFRGAGLGLPTIRRVAERAAKDYGQANPFVNRRFRSDGRKIFLEMSTQPSANDRLIPAGERQLIEVLTGQHALIEVIDPSLFANLEWEGDAASRWWPMGKDSAVVLDPKVSFGAPRIVDTGIPTSAVASAVQAEGGGSDAIAAVADWHGIDAAQVQDALRFETEWLRSAA